MEAFFFDFFTQTARTAQTAQTLLGLYLDLKQLGLGSAQTSFNWTARTLLGLYSDSVQTAQTLLEQLGLSAD